MVMVRPRSNRCVHLLLVLWTACSGGLFGQAEKYEGKRVVNILFVPPSQPVDPAELHDILPVKKNAPLRMADVRAAIDRLYATGCYDDIQVDAEPIGDGVLVRFITKNSWFVGRVAAAGDISDPPNRGQLVNASRLDLGEPFNDEKMKLAESGVKRLLESNGLHESNVQPRFEYDSDRQQVSIFFEIGNGPRARLTAPVVKGEPKLSLDKLVSATHWKRWLVGTWKPATQVRVRRGLEGIRAKYQQDDRLEASVGLEEIRYDADTRRDQPALEIQAGPKVEIRAVGAKLSKKQKKRYIPVYEERTVDHDLLVEGQRNLRDYLQSQGYFEAEVEFKQQRVTNDEAVIDYLINPGKRHKLVYLEIQGNKYFSTDTIRERMFMTPASLLQFRHGRYSESFRRRDEEAITNLYRSNGFRDVSVTSTSQDDYKGKTGDIAVFIKIEEGPQWFVSNLEVVGIEQLDANEILPRLSSIEGQPFSEFNVALDRDAILAFYFTNGFSNATFTWSSKPGRDPRHVDLKYVITEGKRQFVREVLVSGLDITKPGLVNRNLLLNPGDPLSPIRMTDTQRRLYDLGVFAQVDTAIQNPDGETQRKYVLYQMEEAHRYSVVGGIGAEVAKIGGCRNCLEGAAGQAGFAPRVSLDASRLNMFGLGHTLSFRSRVSTLQRRGLLNYSAPRFRNNPALNLSFTSLYDDSRDVRTFSTRRQEGSVQLSQKISKARTALYRFSYRRVSISDLKINRFLFPQAQSVRLGMLSGTLIEDRRDDPADAHKGIYNTLDLGLASRAFGSQKNFFRFLGRNAMYRPVGKKMVLARSTSFGILQPFRIAAGETSLTSIPLPERFFAGGSTSHRGFPENQAGPRDPTTGFPLGGNALLFNSTELRFPLVGDNIGGVFFHDAGNTYSSVSKMSFRLSQRDLKDFDYMVHAVGFGMRYRTPIGPVRADVAWSVNSPRFVGFKGTPEELFNAGINPCETRPEKCVQQRISRFQFFFSIGQTF